MTANITSLRRAALAAFQVNLEKALESLDTLPIKEKLMLYQQIAEFASIQIRNIHEHPEEGPL